MHIRLRLSSSFPPSRLGIISAVREERIWIHRAIETFFALRSRSRVISSSSRQAAENREGHDHLLREPQSIRCCSLPNRSTCSRGEVGVWRKAAIATIQVGEISADGSMGRCRAAHRGREERLPVSAWTTTVSRRACRNRVRVMLMSIMATPARYDRGLGASLRGGRRVRKPQHSRQLLADLAQMVAPQRVPLRGGGSYEEGSGRRCSRSRRPRRIRIGDSSSRKSARAGYSAKCRSSTARRGSHGRRGKRLRLLAMSRHMFLHS